MGRGGRGTNTNRACRTGRGDVLEGFEAASRGLGGTRRGLDGTLGRSSDESCLRTQVIARCCDRYIHGMPPRRALHQSKTCDPDGSAAMSWGILAQGCLWSRPM